MEIVPFPSGPLETNSYLCYSPHSLQAVLIDAPPGCFKKVSAFLTAHHLSLQALLLTHSHWDHTADAHLFKKHYAIPLMVHPLDAPNLISPGADGVPLLFPVEGVTPDKMIEEGDLLALDQLYFQVIHTPGHSPGSLCLYCEEASLLFSGDTLFQGGIGNISFPSSEPKRIKASLKKLLSLPEITLVYPGHGAPTSLGEEKLLLHRLCSIGR